MATEPLTPSPVARYERADASPGGLFVFFVLMAFALVVIAIVLAGVLGYLSQTDRPAPFVGSPFGNTRPIPSEAPLLQPAPGVDIQEYTQSQQRVLNSYGWIDRKSGVVHIPIDQAMQLVLKQGLPARPNPAPARNPNPEVSR